MIIRIVLSLFSLAALWLGCCFTTALAQQEIVTLPTRPGVTQSYFLTSVPKNLQAVAILFPGSGGVRLRTKWHAEIQPRRFLAEPLRVHQARRGPAIVDAPSDQQGGWGMGDGFALAAIISRTSPPW
jgi:hypothetical protein